MPVSCYFLLAGSRRLLPSSSSLLSKRRRAVRWRRNRPYSVSRQPEVVQRCAWMAHAHVMAGANWLLTDSSGTAFLGRKTVETLPGSRQGGRSSRKEHCAAAPSIAGAAATGKLLPVWHCLQNCRNPRVLTRSAVWPRRSPLLHRCG